MTWLGEACCMTTGLPRERPRGGYKFRVSVCLALVGDVSCLSLLSWFVVVVMVVAVRRVGSFVS